jgi:hypothetical protein
VQFTAAAAGGEIDNPGDVCVTAGLGDRADGARRR